MIPYSGTHCDCMIHFDIWFQAGRGFYFMRCVPSLLSSYIAETRSVISCVKIIRWCGQTTIQRASLRSHWFIVLGPFKEAEIGAALRCHYQTTQGERQFNPKPVFHHHRAAETLWAEECTTARR